MKIEVFDKNGKVVETLELSEGVFGVSPKLELLKQYIRVYLFNQRQGTGSSKTRREVAGSGRKLWKQKKTGRARMGSIRSPLWRGGGIAHGPKPKDWRLDLPKKMRRLAVISALSIKQAQDRIFILDKLSMKQPKTKEIVGLLGRLNLPGKTLFVLDNSQANILKSCANLKNVSVGTSENLNAFEVMKSANVLFLKDAVLSVQKRFGA